MWVYPALLPIVTFIYNFHILFVIEFFAFYLKYCTKVLFILIIALFGDPLHFVTEARASLTSPLSGPERERQKTSVLGPYLWTHTWSSPQPSERRAGETEC